MFFKATLLKPNARSLYQVSQYLCHNSASFISCAAKYTFRTHTCGELCAEHVGQNVYVCGWLKHKRFPKFFVLDDAYGSVQIYNDIKDENLLDVIRSLPLESVLAVHGKVAFRPEKDRTQKMFSGQIEIQLKELSVLNSCEQPLPVDVNDFTTPNQVPRLTYRYLDLRRPSMQHMLRFRAKLISRMRSFLESQQFVEVETPMLFRRTPGGAQEFVVPSSNDTGAFYCLPQSPQQFKQLLMVAGLDRYFQVARCFRDEGSKPDRQPEFTQLDIELSFAGQQHVMQLIEDVIVASWPEELQSRYSTPAFQRMTYRDAMTNYGSDKPDLRFEHRIERRRSCAGGGEWCFVQVPDTDELWQPAVVDSWRRRMERQHCRLPANFLVARLDGSEEEQTLAGCLKIKPGSFAVALAVEQDFPVAALKSLGLLRQWIADFQESKGLKVRRDTMSFLWITDFPLFELDNENTPSPAKLRSVHHPFTAPKDLSIEKTVGDILVHHESLDHLIAAHYDLVLNGQELGGGSVRIHNAEQQLSVLEGVLGEDTTEMKHLIDALRYGAPPHAGFAIGIDRYVALLLKCQSIRDVIAFPKSGEGRDLMTKAPTTISNDIMQRYHINVVD